MGQGSSCGANYGVARKLREHIAIGNAEDVLTVLLAYPYLIARAWVWCAAAKCGHIAVLQALVTSFQQLRQEDANEASQPCDQEALTASNKLVESCVNTPDSSGLTPLSTACMYGNVEATRWLLTAGADPYHADRREGRTALHLAVFNGHAECCKVLLEQMPRTLQPTSETPPRHRHRLIEASTRNGARPIHFATECGHADVVVLLLRFRVDICAQVLNQNFHLLVCNCGTTALHIAAANGDVHIAMLILKHYAYNLMSSGVVDPRTIANRTGMMPFQIAYLNNRHRLAVLLRCTYPFSWLFRAPEAGPPPLVPTLATLAAAVLQADLFIQIEVIVAEAKARQAPDARGPTPPPSHQWVKRQQAQQLVGQPLLLTPQLRTAVPPNFVPDCGAGSSSVQIPQGTIPRSRTLENSRFVRVSLPQSQFPSGSTSLVPRPPSPPFRASYSGAVQHAVTPSLPRGQRLAALYALSTVSTSYNGSSVFESEPLTPHWTDTLQASQAQIAVPHHEIPHLTLSLPNRPASANAVLGTTPRSRHNLRASQPSLISVTPLPESPRADLVDLTPRWIQLEEITSGEAFLDDSGPSHFGGIPFSWNGRASSQVQGLQQQQQQQRHRSEEQLQQKFSQSNRQTPSETKDQQQQQEEEVPSQSVQHHETSSPHPLHGYACSSSYPPHAGTKQQPRNSVSPLPLPHSISAHEIHPSANGSSDDPSSQESQPLPVSASTSLQRLLVMLIPPRPPSATNKRVLTLSGSQLTMPTMALPPLPPSSGRRRAPSVPINQAITHNSFDRSASTQPGAASPSGVLDPSASSQAVPRSSLPRRRQLRLPEQSFNNSGTSASPPTFTPTEAMKHAEEERHQHPSPPSAGTADPAFNNPTFESAAVDALSGAHYQALSHSHRSSAAATFSLHGLSLAGGSLTSSMRRRPASASTFSLAGRNQIRELILLGANQPEVLSEVLTEQRAGEQTLSAPQLGDLSPAMRTSLHSHNLPANPGHLWSPYSSSQRPASRRILLATDNESDGGDSSCGVCFEEMALGCRTTFTGCGHVLCGTCAKALVAAIKASPATCPFCRQPIQGFREAGGAALVLARAAAAVVAAEKAAAAEAAAVAAATAPEPVQQPARYELSEGQVMMPAHLAGEVA